MRLKFARILEDETISTICFREIFHRESKLEDRCKLDEKGTITFIEKAIEKIIVNINNWF